MYRYCHRCGSELPEAGGDLPFCPHCGSPQLLLPEYEEQTGSAEGNTTGAIPPPRPRQVEWRTAVQCAALVAAIAALLSLISARVQVVSPLTWLWTLSGSLITLAMYQRRRPLAWMDAGIGARIGVLVGLALMACFAITMSAAGLFARYVLHSMAGFDVQLTAMLHAQVQKAAATAPEPPGIVQFLYSPEVRAGMMLAGFAMLSGLLMVLSTLGGAVGGLLRTKPKVSA